LKPLISVETFSNLVFVRSRPIRARADAGEEGLITVILRAIIGENVLDLALRHQPEKADHLPLRFGLLCGFAFCGGHGSITQTKSATGITTA
jgi:hypothetical protein